MRLPGGAHIAQLDHEDGLLHLYPAAEAEHHRTNDCPCHPEMRYVRGEGVTVIHSHLFRPAA